MTVWRGQVVFGVVCYGLFLGMQMPARWAFERVAPWVAPVRLSGLSGTVWSGEFASLEWGSARFGPGSWRFL
ncbi:MAG: hypothetical protein HQL99_17040, partial [Magnetococcales bacterium]|nr:hypothetical protein [Magnetococcales bacterium]